MLSAQPDAVQMVSNYPPHLTLRQTLPAIALSDTDCRRFSLAEKPWEEVGDWKTTARSGSRLRRSTHPDRIAPFSRFGFSPGPIVMHSDLPHSEMPNHEMNSPLLIFKIKVLEPASAPYRGSSKPCRAARIQKNFFHWMRHSAPWHRCRHGMDRRDIGVARLFDFGSNADIHDR